MRNLVIYWVASLTLVGCVGPQPTYKIGKNDALNSRVTRAAILASGGICNDEDICADIKKHQDYDCTAEASCFPIHKK